MSMDYAEDELDALGLTEEQKAILLEDDEDVADDLRELIGDDNADDEDGGEALAGGSVDERTGADTFAEATEKPLDPVYVQHSDPAALSADIEKAMDELKALRADFRRGELEIEDDEFDERVDALQDRISGLREARAVAEAATRTNEQIARQAWLHKADLFMEQVRARDGINLKDEATFREFDRALRFIGADEATANWSEQQFFDEAYKMAAARLGLAPTRKESSKRDELEVRLQQRRQSADEALKMPNLSRVPSAGTESVDEGGEFAYIDRLSGLDAEKAIARLTPEQLDRYLAS